MSGVGFYSIWPFLVCLAVLYGIATTPVLRIADFPARVAVRNQTLDGLRGFLALAVLFHHGAIYHEFLVTGVWDIPRSDFYTVLGQAGVGMFFMITGYLFWGKVVRERRSGLNWRALYLGRVLRIGPLYLLSVGAMLLIVGWNTHWSLHEPIGVVAIQVGQWLSLGMSGLPDVNGYLDTSSLLAGVTWSLGYEWVFYLSLPVWACLLSLSVRIAPSRPALFALALPLLAFTLCLLESHIAGYTSEIRCAALFSIGMVSVGLPVISHGPDWVRSTVAAGLIIAALTLFPSGYNTVPVLLLGGAFLLISSGCTVFGVLTSRPARRLGEISYGIYLMQGLALDAVMRPAAYRALVTSSPALHWLLLLGASILLLGFATIAHVAVERPGIELGRKLLRGKLAAAERSYHLS